MNLLRRPVLLVPVLLALATACGGSETRSGGSAAAAAAPGIIVIESFEFAPETLSAKVGDTITVRNNDTAEHTVTATDRSFDTGRFARGTKTFTVTKPGRFEYVCDVHPFMTRRFIQVAA